MISSTTQISQFQTPLIVPRQNQGHADTARREDMLKRLFTIRDRDKWEVIHYDE